MLNESERYRVTTHGLYLFVKFMCSYNEIVFVKSGGQGKIKTKFIKQVPPTIDDRQIWLSLVISNSQLYISHMPNYHCSTK
jgi:hypothetical protein